jgi:hypothetical protein
MMETARTSETSVYNYFTRQYNPEDNSELHTRRRENSKSHKINRLSANWPDAGNLSNYKLYEITFGNTSTVLEWPYCTVSPSINA